MALTLADAVSNFGKAAKAKLSNPAAYGQPEDQIRAPFEQLVADLAGLAGLPPDKVVSVGESSVSEAHTRPDYAITVHSALTGFIELKAPGKGADPRKFKDAHDKAQWLKLQSLPNLIYSDGNEFSLWQDGELVGTVVRLEGDIESSGSKLEPGAGLSALFESFLSWQPIAPTSAKELAQISARLCRLLRDEVSEELERKGPAMAGLAADWRKLLFPEASNRQFADGYAQSVTFGLLMARARGISVLKDLHGVAESLKKSNTLIGSALQLLTDSEETRKALATSLGALERVLEVVDWPKLSKGSSDAWLYFYEEFLDVYDKQLRKQTGSYYTPPEVVAAMVRLVDQALRTTGFDLAAGLASPSVSIADPAAGTGTYILGVLRNIAAAVAKDEGEGAVKASIEAALARIVAFELQLGPYAVGQLRIIAEVVALTGAPPKNALRMFVTDTLSNPDEEEAWIPNLFASIAKQRKDANKVKRDVPITVCLGNPPYKEKAKGLGGWVEGQTRKEEKNAILHDWMPPPAWGAGAHSKHLRNLYIYFWRWATWKVFEHHPDSNRGIVCFITVAGFLSGPGFQKMRADLRERCNAIWVIDCSPEGHQPKVSTRIFQGVQQPICIVLAARWEGGPHELPADVQWISLPLGHRQEKFDALGQLSLSDSNWTACPNEGRAPFLPGGGDAWTNYPSLEDFFVYNGAGVMPGRTWVIAPDAESLERRWDVLVSASANDKEGMFHPHLRNGKMGDKHSQKLVPTPLAGFPPNVRAVANEFGASLKPVRYAFRTLDHQWIIPDSRLINQPNPKLWELRSERQVFLTAFTEESPSGGPALTVTGLIPDLHHYKGSFGGRVFPLWADSKGEISNVRTRLLEMLSKTYGVAVEAEDVVAYIAALTAHPAYVERFRGELSTPGLRIPLTADGALFAEAAGVGRRAIWLHCFGERMADAKQDRPSGPPRLPIEQRPHIPKDAAIPSDTADMPDSMAHDPATLRLSIGKGWVEGVPQAVWDYAVSGKQILPQWFSYRRKTRDRPIMGDRRKPSPLSSIQPDAWPAQYTSELLNLLNVIGYLVQLEPIQEDILDRVCAGELLSLDVLQVSGALGEPTQVQIPKSSSKQPSLF